MLHTFHHKILTFIQWYLENTSGVLKHTFLCLFLVTTLYYTHKKCVHFSYLFSDTIQLTLFDQLLIIRRIIFNTSQSRKSTFELRFYTPRCLLINQMKIKLSIKYTQGFICFKNISIRKLRLPIYFALINSKNIILFSNSNIC